MSEDAELPRRKVAHLIDEALDALSVADIEERIVLLRQEIERLEVAKRLKRTARDQAGSVFKS